MPRPQTRTELVDPQLTAPLKDLFGTTQNMYIKLRLSELNVSYAELYRAVTGHAVSEETGDKISDACRAWIRQWVLGGTKNRKPLTFHRAADDEEAELLDRYL